MFTQYQLDQIKKRALEKGFTEEEVNVNMQRMVSEFNSNQGLSNPTLSMQKNNNYQQQSQYQPSQNQQIQFPQNQQSGGMLQQPQQGQNNGSIVGNFFKSIYDMGANYGKFVGESVYQAGRFVADPAVRKSVMGQYDKMTDEELKRAGQENTLFYKKDFNEKLGDAGKIAKTGAKATAGAMALVAPAGNTIKGAMALGAASGGLQAFSEEDATIESIGSGIITGGLTGGIIKGSSNIMGKGLKWIFKNGVPNKIQNNYLLKIGDFLREDATQIRAKPSIYGASKEKQIQKTLDYLGIKGGPQQKYEQLLPKMDDLNNQIADILDNNPKTVSIKSIISLFKKNLQDEVRTKTLTSNSAKKEIGGYLADLLKLVDDGYTKTGKEITGKTINSANDITLQQAFDLKKIINKDYGSIAKKALNNTPLTDREKIILYGRQTLDSVISEALPEVKNLTMMQSHLYDAAKSLSSARNTVPTFRVFGITIPQHRRVEDFVGRLFSEGGEYVDKINKSINIKKDGMQKAIDSLSQDNQKLLLDSIIKAGVITTVRKENGHNPNKDTNQDSQQGGANIEQHYSGNGQQNYDQQNLQNGTHDQIIPQNQMNYVDNAPKPFGGKSKGELLQLALSEGLSMKELQEVSATYDFIMENVYGGQQEDLDTLLARREQLQKAGFTTPNIDAQIESMGYGRMQGGGTENLSLTDGAIKNISDIQGAISDIQNLGEQISQSNAIGPIMGMRRLNPYDTNAQSLQAEIDRVRQVVGKAIEGGVLRKEDEEKYKKILPTTSDTKAVALRKLQDLQEKLNQDLNNYVSLQSTYGKGAGQSVILQGQNQYQY